MENLKVERVVICRQGKESLNYEKFKEIVKEKKIKVSVIKKRRWNKHWKRYKTQNSMAPNRANRRKYFK